MKKKEKTHKWCTGCEDSLPIDNFYVTPKGVSSQCIECIRKKRNEYDREQRRLEIDLEGLRPLNDPMKYNSIQEQKDVRSLLEIIGYHFNEELNLFWKEGVRNEDGSFISKTPSEEYIKNPPRGVIVPGHMIGALKIIKETERRLNPCGQYKRRVLVECTICGNEKEMDYGNLSSKNTQTCSMKCFKTYNLQQNVNNNK